jgi:branched-chain amino acid transport system substrate-binding protein
MKRISSFLFGLLMLAFAGCSGGKPDIRIGFVGPLTGDAANYGKLMTQAVRIAVEERNEKGGINGVPVVFVPEDDEGKPEKAVPAIEKLAGVDHVYGIIGAVFSSCALAIAPKAQAEKIVMITPSSTHKALTSKGNFIFRNVLSDELQAQVFGLYTAQVLKVKTVAVLYLKNDYSQGLAEDFKTAYETAGGKVTSMESALQGDKDFKTQLTRIKAQKPEALYMPCYVAEMAQILSQAKDLGLTVKFLSGDGYSNPDIFSLAGDLADGVIFANSAEESGPNPIRQAFVDKYAKKWGEKPDSFSLNSYDNANLIMDALEKAQKASTNGQIDRDLVRANVAAVSNYPGVSGSITFLPGKGDAIKNVGIFRAEKKGYTQIAAYRLDGGKLSAVH